MYRLFLFCFFFFAFHGHAQFDNTECIKKLVRAGLRHGPVPAVHLPDLLASLQTAISELSGPQALVLTESSKGFERLSEGLNEGELDFHRNRLQKEFDSLSSGTNAPKTSFFIKGSNGASFFLEQAGRSWLSRVVPHFLAAPVGAASFMLLNRWLDTLGLPVFVWEMKDRVFDPLQLVPCAAIDFAIRLGFPLTAVAGVYVAPEEYEKALFKRKSGRLRGLNHDLHESVFSGHRPHYVLFWDRKSGETMDLLIGKTEKRGVWSKGPFELRSAYRTHGGDELNFFGIVTAGQGN